MVHFGLVNIPSLLLFLKCVSVVDILLQWSGNSELMLSLSLSVFMFITCLLDFWYYTYILQKILGFIQLGCLIFSWLRSSLWLQFKPNQIAAGAAYLAAKILNMNLASNNIIWQEFQTPPNVLRDVARQLMELL